MPLDSSQLLSILCANFVLALSVAEHQSLILASGINAPSLMCTYWHLCPCRINLNCNLVFLHKGRELAPTLCVRD